MTKLQNPMTYLLPQRLIMIKIAIFKIKNHCFINCQFDCSNTFFSLWQTSADRKTSVTHKVQKRSPSLRLLIVCASVSLHPKQFVFRHYRHFLVRGRGSHRRKKTKSAQSKMEDDEEERSEQKKETFHRFQRDSIAPPNPHLLITLPKKTFTYG